MSGDFFPQPATDPARVRVLARPSPGETTSGFVVLVAGQPSANELLTRALASSGFFVLQAGTDPLTEAELRCLPVDVLIFGADLPPDRMWAYACGQAKQGRTPQLIAVVAGWREGADRAEIERLGIACLEEPTDAPEFRSRLRTALERRAPRKENEDGLHR